MNQLKRVAGMLYMLLVAGALTFGAQTAMSGMTVSNCDTPPGSCQTNEDCKDLCPLPEGGLCTPDECCVCFK